MKKIIDNQTTYIRKEEFLNIRKEALNLMTYLIGFWEIKQDELDFKE